QNCKTQCFLCGHLQPHQERYFYAFMVGLTPPHRCPWRSACLSDGIKDCRAVLSASRGKGVVLFRSPTDCFRINLHPLVPRPIQSALCRSAQERTPETVHHGSRRTVADAACDRHWRYPASPDYTSPLPGALYTCLLYAGSHNGVSSPCPARSC